MIISFSFSNFRSFHQEQTLSLIAAKRFGDEHPHHTTRIPGSREKVLKTAVLYGANGAGKSNVVKALECLRDIVLEARPRHATLPSQAFKLTPSTEAVSELDLQFICAGQTFRYGCKFDNKFILEEWLLTVKGSREKTVFERVTTAEGQVKVEAPGLSLEKTRAFATIGGPGNQSFLASLRANLELVEIDEILQSILHWFERGLNVITPNSRTPGLPAILAKESNLFTFAQNFLQAASTGVDGLQVSQRALSEKELQALPTGLPEKLLALLQKKEVVGFAMETPATPEMFLTLDEQQHLQCTQIQAEHKTADGSTIKLDWAEESDGTRRLLELIPALFDLHQRDAVYVVDEIDRSLHPMLVRKFVECFLQSCEKNARQIIITTHESSLLDLDLLRRDEIWFTEKDANHASHLYSLADFKVRSDLEIRKHYLQGRFGGVPFLGNIDRLVEPAEV